MAFYLHPSLKAYFHHEQPLFDQIMALSGDTFRHQDGRLTQRIMLGDRQYFIKQHYGVGYQEIIKNLLQGRFPIVSAKNEWTALNKLKALNIAAPTVVGYGERGYNPATLQSFVLMESLLPAVSLEDFCRHWQLVTPAFTIKQALIKKIATIARTMHENGINHRDFYLCHFLLSLTPVKDFALTSNKLHVIDLHRAATRRRCRPRWIIKDIAGLFFSTKDIGLTQRDLFRFMKIYRKNTLRYILSQEHDFWLKVQLRGEKLYHDHGK